MQSEEASEERDPLSTPDVSVGEAVTLASDETNEVSETPDENADQTEMIHVRFFSGQPDMLYQKHYVWFVFYAFLSVVLSLVVSFMGGRELNSLARDVYERGGVNELLIFKLGLTILFIIMCEWIGRRQRQTGLKLVRFGVIVSAIPTLLLLIQFLILCIQWLWEWLTVPAEKEGPILVLRALTGVIS